MMKPSFYAGASGLIATQRVMDTVGNNLANINTYGYKPEVASFQTLLSDEMYVKAESDPLSGGGVRAVGQGMLFNQGSPRNTGNQWDFAIVGEGLFSLEVDGERLYTRDGAFSWSVEGEDLYLTSKNGGYVLDRIGDHIAATYITHTTGTTSADGTEHTNTTKEIDYAVLKDQIGVFEFDHPGGLESASNNMYRTNTLSGRPIRADTENYELLQTYLENSATSLADEMADLIAAQRAYQLCARVVQTSDEIEQTVSGLRR